MSKDEHWQWPNGQPPDAVIDFWDVVFGPNALDEDPACTAAQGREFSNQTTLCRLVCVNLYKG